MCVHCEFCQVKHAVFFTRAVMAVQGCRYSWYTTVENRDVLELIRQNADRTGVKTEKMLKVTQIDNYTIHIRPSLHPTKNRQQH